MWQRKHLKLYPNRLEFYQKSRDGIVMRSKGVEVCGDPVRHHLPVALCPRALPPALTLAEKGHRPSESLFAVYYACRCFYGFVEVSPICCGKHMDIKNMLSCCHTDHQSSISLVAYKHDRYQGHFTRLSED